MTFLKNLSKNTLESAHLGLLTETHEVLLRLIKTQNIHVLKMAAPTEDRFPRVLRLILANHYSGCRLSLCLWFKLTSLIAKINIYM